MTQWGLDALFNPGKKHMDEEKRRLKATRAEVGDSSGGKRIDLESGKVTIRRKTDGDPAAEDADENPADGETDAEAGDAEAGDAEAGDAVTDDATDGPYPADGSSA